MADEGVHYMAQRLETRRTAAYVSAREKLYKGPDGEKTGPFSRIESLLEEARIIQKNSPEEVAEQIKFIGKQISDILGETVIDLRKNGVDMPSKLTITQDKQGDTTVYLDLEAMEFHTTEAGFALGPSNEMVIEYMGTNIDGDLVPASYLTYTGLPQQWPIETFASSYTAIAMTSIYSILSGSSMTGKYTPHSAEVSFAA